MEGDIIRLRLGVLIVELLVVHVDGLEILGRSRKSWGNSSDELDVGAGLDSAEHHCVDSHEDIFEDDIEVLGKYGCDVVNEANDKGYQALREGHCETRKDRVAVGHFQAIVLPQFVSADVTGLEVETSYCLVVDYWLEHHLVTAFHYLVRVLAESCQEFHLEHSGHHYQGDEQESD